MKLPRTVVAVLGGFFQQALAIRAPTSSAAFATAALEFRTASCALTHRRLHSLSPTILCQHERVSASFSHVGRAASVRRLATSSEFFRVCSQWPQLLRRGFRACYAVSYAIWYVLIYAVTPCASERSAFSASFRRVATGHAWPSEIRERHS